MRAFLMGIVCVCLLFTGCVTRVIENTRRPELEITDYGTILLNGKVVQRGKIAKAMRSAGFERGQEVNILISNHPDRDLMASVAGEVVQGGYRRTVFVTKKQAFSEVPVDGKRQGPPVILQQQNAPKRVIRRH